MEKFELLKKNHAGLMRVKGINIAINYGVIDILFHDEKKETGILIFFNSKGIDMIKPTAPDDEMRKYIFKMVEDKNYHWLIFRDYIAILALENIDKVMF